MRIIDRIALNRLIIMITTCIINIIKIFGPQTVDTIDVIKPKPKRKKILPWRNKDE